jgi:hypothetical protein
LRRFTRTARPLKANPRPVPAAYCSGGVQPNICKPK